MFNFYKKLGPISYNNILSALEINEKSSNYKNISFSSFKGLNNCSKNDLTFLYDGHNFSSSAESPKGIIISTKRKDISDFKNIITIIVPDVHSSVAKISNLFYRDLSNSEKIKLKKTNIKKNYNISKSAIIKNGCKIGADLFVGDGSVILEGCIIGKNVKIGSNTIIQNSIIGDNVEIENNCSIGQPGFGFAFQNNSNLKIYHIGRVVIQDNCYIGSNCTIDRGSFSDTYIGENVYLDNQVHIAHNVKIGSNSVLAGQCGIAGSANIGSYVKMGGQVGIVGHVKIGDHVEIAAKSGVRNSIENNQRIMGDPAINMFTHLKKTLKTNKVN
ncbi:MAG: UDP-3-O-(3-hydroxymyristoyl)glucosamine N-acyltransferase [Pelagibacterales bacterium]|nr:UDP-3-O-(3-hydroxymyristoyl)glucosamine N-acyltransferase [Pelagibacterales bacterium]